MSRFLKLWWWVVLYLTIYYVANVSIAWNRWQQYEIFYFDHGIFDTALVKTARFEAPLIDHNEEKPLNQLGDHFTLLMYVLLPLYWLFPQNQILFFIQPLLVVCSAAILLKIAWRRTGSKWFVGALMIALTYFVGMQNALLGDFHGDLMVLVPLALMLDALDRKKWKQYVMWTLLVLLSKESNSTIVMGVAVYLLSQKQWKMAAISMIMAGAYTYAITRWVMPKLAGRSYEYAGYIPPLTGFIERMFLPVIKTKTMLVSLLTFGFLPLLAIGFMPVILQDWVVRFVMNPVATRFDLGMHYNAVTAILLAYGAILGYEKLQKWHSGIVVKKILPILIIITVLVIQRFWYRGPLGLATNKAFYAHSQDFGFLNKLVEVVPDGGRVMTSNNLAGRFIRTHEVILYRMDYEGLKPSAIVFDLREGQGINNFWPLSESETRQLYHKVMSNDDYELKQVGKDQIVFVLKK